MRVLDFIMGYSANGVRARIVYNGDYEITGADTDGVFRYRCIVPDFIVDFLKEKYKDNKSEWRSAVYMLELMKDEFGNWEAAMPADMQQEFIEEMAYEHSFGDFVF